MEMYLSKFGHLVVWALHGILSIPKIILIHICSHGSSSCHEKPVLNLSVAGKKNQETKMEKTRNAYLEKKHGYKIKKLRS